MKRREFLQLSAMMPLLLVAPRGMAAVADAESGWRTFELTYEVDLSAHLGAGRLWLPLPGNAGDYQRALATDWQAGTASAALTLDPSYLSPVLAVAWQDETAARSITATIRVSTRDRHMAAVLPTLQDAADAALYLRPTDHMPVDGIVADTAGRIVQGLDSPDARARAIYDWIVDNTFRNPDTRGCGMGDIKFMLESGDLSGKCADINSLFVGLARAAGLPAREAYGVRVAESNQLKCLGRQGDISKAQHCRAEYFSPSHGWVGVDPADVRKAVLEAKLPLTDPKIVELRNRLFGYWEMNWVAFNHARDFELNPRASRPLPYLMYPYAEIGDSRIDGRDPADFKYRLSSREITAAA